VFRSTPPQRGDPKSRVGGHVRGFDDSPAATRASRSRCFDPRPRKGATSPPFLVPARCAVYPSKGRLPDPAGGMPVEVSIHAPAKGRRPMTHQRYSRYCFDPRPRKAGDQLPLQQHTVSIHAPAKGRHEVQPTHIATFRSTPPQRGDPDRWQPRPADQVSIHAPAKGRLGASATREISRAVSIHAPAKGRPPIL
jgi:hypothetical protein